MKSARISPPERSGSIPLFRLFGVRVYLHWWWFVFAAFELALRSRAYTSYTWNVAEMLEKEQVSMRLGLVEYKDRGDRYVTRTTPMTRDVRGFL
ncbi:MAG: hypothetical protein RLZZ221_3013, partial [Verrucomicrobiota bacterium]